MTVILNGIGKIKCGTYEEIVVEGMGFAKDPITVKKILVAGTMKGKKVRCTKQMKVEGIMVGDIQFGARTRFKAILGNAVIEKQENGHTSFDVEGELRADVVAVEVFKIKGRCRINKLETVEATLTPNPSENKILKSRNLENRKSEVGEIVCNRLVAYGLKAEKVVAEEVQLYDACEIGTLICKKKTYCSPDCVIVNELDG